MTILRHIKNLNNFKIQYIHIVFLFNFVKKLKDNTYTNVLRNVIIAILFLYTFTIIKRLKFITLFVKGPD